MSTYEYENFFQKWIRSFTERWCNPENDDEVFSSDHCEHAMTCHTSSDMNVIVMASFRASVEGKTVYGKNTST